jgi:hypothetical protein
MDPAAAAAYAQQMQMQQMMMMYGNYGPQSQPYAGYAAPGAGMVAVAIEPVWGPNAAAAAAAAAGGTGAAVPAEGQQQAGEDEEEGEAPDKRSERLPVWGNQSTMNMESVLHSNIQSSDYFKQLLFARAPHFSSQVPKLTLCSGARARTCSELKTWTEVVNEIIKGVKYLGAVSSPGGRHAPKAHRAVPPGPPPP